MNEEVRKAILGGIGLLIIGVATAITKNPNCLWGIILVILLVEAN